MKPTKPQRNSLKERAAAMKKRITSIMLALSMALSLVPVFSAPAFSSGGNLTGTGTADDPFLIEDLTDFNWFKTSGDKTKCYALTTNITLTGNWTPINAFSGTFDGRNHTIAGINVNGSYDYAGFFRMINGGTVKNLHLKGNVANTNTKANYGGGLAGLVDGTTRITNCSFTGGSVTASQYAGGLIGAIEQNVSSGVNVIITDCYVKSDIYDSYTGNKYDATLIGFVGGNGLSSTARIERCYAEATNKTYTTNQAARTGGFIGQTHNISIDVVDCYAKLVKFNYAFYGAYFYPLNSPCSITFENCFTYSDNTSIDLTSYSAPTETYTNAYMLNSTSTSSDITAYNNPTDYTDKTKFTGFNFSDTGEWTIGTDYPILQPRIYDADISRELTYYGDANGEFNLTDYFHVALDKNKNYNNVGRFTYSVTANETKPERVWDNINYQWINGSNNITLASINSEKLVLNKDMPIGTYSVTVHATPVNASDEFDAFDMEFTINKKQHVPVPSITTADVNKLYSRSLTLADIGIEPGVWAWDDPTICPKNYDASLYVYNKNLAYDAFYAFDSTLVNASNYTTYYDWSDVINAGFNVTDDGTGSGIKVVLNPLVIQSSDSPWPRSIYVYDADTGDPIPGATVTCAHLTTDLWDDEFPDPAYQTGGTSGLSDSSGYVYSELSPGSHELTASASGYDPKTQTEMVTSGVEDPLAPIKIYLDPKRGSIKLPPVYLKTPDGSGGYVKTKTAIPNAKVTLTKISSATSTNSWNGGQDSLTGSVDDTVTLPNNSKFKLSSFTYGYSTDEAIYIETDGTGAVKYYKDEACTDEITDPDYRALWAAALDEPTYTLTIDDKDASGNPLNKGEYRVMVDLQYIKATYGSFGIKYDPEIFTLNPASDIAVGSEIDHLDSVEDMYGGTWSNKEGYYAFTWHVKGGQDAVLDTELTKKNIATFTFRLNNTDDADAPSYDWFNIEIWTDTLPAKALIAADPTDPANEMHWRPCDIDNTLGNLKPGRIEAGKAVINGVDTKGFFQASVNGDLAGGSAPSSFYDVKTVLDYKIQMNNSMLYFHVYDGSTNADLDLADVDLYNHSPTGFVQQKTTGSDGWARFYINTSTGLYGPTFAYTVSRQGYWPIPVDGLVSSRPTVTAPTTVVTKVQVPMEKKIYHVPIVNNTGLVGVGNRDLGGEKYAYNGRDFHFRAKAAKGYRITQYPTTAKVEIWDESSGSLQPLYTTNLPVNPIDGYFTIPGTDLTQRTLEDMYTNLGNQYSLMMQNESAYYDDIFSPGTPFNPTGGPDAEGFRSYNLYITFDNFHAEEIPYLVEGVTNDENLGTVTYSYVSGTELDEDHTSPPADNDHYRRVITTTGSGANRKTGTFHFQAVGSNKIEKVYINGIRSYGYDGETQMDYTFGDVDMDCNITVIFWDGVNHSQDKLMTLVVGEYGYVTPNSADHVENPNKITNTRRVYLNKGDLDFDWDTDFPVYELYKVEKELETSGTKTRATLTSQTNNYVINENAGENTIVYVTFKHKDANPATTPNRFVKSYVMQGKGVVAPAGVLIYCLYDTVDLQLDADQSVSTSPYTVKGVELQDFDTLAQTDTYDYAPAQPQSAAYTYPSLKDNIAIGAVFVEPTLGLTGQIDYSQNASVTLGNCLTGGTVRFMRLDGSMNEIPNQVPYIFNTTNARKTATFSASIPAGRWNVYFEKPGYVTYKITEFYMDSSVASFGGTRKVVPYIGSTMGGKYVLLVDAANIRSGWRTGANSVIKDQADVDNDGAVQNYDLIYVWHNYNKRLVEQTYSDFCSLGSPALTEAAPF